jgi:FMN-dependent NADH-azoreductase
MKNLLVINSSGRVTRSITRHLTSRIASGWLARLPGGRVTERDVGTRPPTPVDEAWIAAAFADRQPGETSAALRESDRLIAEVVAADAIAIGTPIYNFGMPAQLKAWFDQVVRIGKTFAFDPAAEAAYRPLLEDKPAIIVISAGDGAMHPGGAFWHMNHLEPHLRTVLGFIGITDLHFIRAGYDEFQDDRTKRSLSAAEGEADRILEVLLPVPVQAARVREREYLTDVYSKV